jgi:16S rRNA (cytosine967-C5)-methyltransferase
MSSDPVRRRALDILIRTDAGEPFDVILDREMGRLGEARDRLFLASLARGTLQWQARYDHVIQHFSKRRPPTDPGLIVLLRLSLHQLLAQDGVPAYAAIHQAGELCRGLKNGRRASGFVNGLLQTVRRQVLGDGKDPVPASVIEERLRPLFKNLEKDRAAWCAAWYSHPRWLVDRWTARWGEEEAAKLCDHNNRPVPLHFRVLEPADPDRIAVDLASAGIPVETGPVPRCLKATDRPGREVLRAALGQFSALIVQDPTVQRATAWLMDDLEGLEGPVLDMCAAPGGKTAVLAANWPGRVIAMDSSARRARLLVDTLKRIEAVGVPVVLADGEHPPVAAVSMAGVLLDGPCSGTGVLRHHPDGRWRLKPEVPAERAKGLARLAQSAADLLAPGGRLMYGTCSLEPEENEDVVKALLAERPDLEPVPDAEGRWHRLWLPHETGGDGFFAARLRRRTEG